MSERDFEAWNLRLKTAWFKEISLVSFCTHAFTMLSASLLGRVSPSELQRPGMGSGCHGYHPDWPKAWLPVKGPCEYEGGKAPPPPPGIPKPRGGGTQLHSRERWKIWGRKNREWVTHVELDMVHLQSFTLVWKTECMTKLSFALWYVYIR